MWGISGLICLYKRRNGLIVGCVSCSTSYMIYVKVSSLVIVALLSMSTSFADDIALPAPARKGGMPLNEALAARKTTRKMDKARELSPEHLSGLLWAANGMNRPAKRTAPTARNKQELELIVLLPSGSYAYDARGNKLVRLGSENLLPVADGFGTAEILIVADRKKQINDTYNAVDSGFIGQNAYLYGASEGLAIVFRGAVDRDSLHAKLGLGDDKTITYTISAGYPAQ